MIANNLLEGEEREREREKGSGVGLELKEKRNVGVRVVEGKRMEPLSENEGGSERGRKHLSTRYAASLFRERCQSLKPLEVARRFNLSVFYKTLILKRNRDSSIGTVAPQCRKSTAHITPLM